MQNLKQDHKQLLQWYLANHRPLPWRANRDPYRIWISEVMLQQTTVTAVVPFYERFMKLFPNVQTLAKAPLEHVLEAWAGLGYYSRARNLHRASQLFAEQGFPKTHLELTEFPGLGPYTSRAISSIAFDENVGVLDGNVIRILSRKYGIDVEWWNQKDRQRLQTRADELAQHGQSSDFNQAMMELGATVCTPQNPACLLCPWNKTCVAREENIVQKLPRPKPRRPSEIWLYQAELRQNRDKVHLVTNEEGPFLKGQWMFPGKFMQLKKKPKDFDLRHSITHHDIFIEIKTPKKVMASKGVAGKWVEIKNIKQWNPSSLLQKILQQALKESLKE